MYTNNSKACIKLYSIVKHIVIYHTSKYTVNGRHQYIYIYIYNNNIVSVCIH